MKYYKDSLNNPTVTTPIDIAWLENWIKLHESWFEIRYVKFMLQDWNFECRERLERENYEDTKQEEEEIDNEYV